MSETAIVHACVIYLKTVGCLVWRNNTGGAYYPSKTGRRPYFVRFNERGASDILGFGPPPDGRGIAVEVKCPGKKPTVHQQVFLSTAQAHGAFAVVVHSVDELERAWLAR